MSDQEDDLDIGQRDFQRVVENHAKEGYKEGISDGRESEFQTGFDLGFKDGIQIGFLRGQLLAQKELQSLPEDPSQKLPCASCSTPDLFDLKEISQTNQESANIIKEDLATATTTPPDR